MELDLRRRATGGAGGTKAAVLALLALLGLLASPASAREAARLSNGVGPHDPVTLEITGPPLNEARGPNPFADFRLDVTFTNGERQWKVPGYFAGCSDATQTSCVGGRLWRSHFLPPTPGRYRYRISFRTAPDIVATGGQGQSAGDADGATGEFAVGDRPRDAIRARGILRYTGDGYYRWSGTGEPFFKFGADAPEGALGYSDFDDTPNRGGRRSDWAPHVRDFKASNGLSYLWDSGRKGRGLLGSFEYLRDVGANSVSMLLFNVGGDDQNVVPQLMMVSPDKYAALDPKDQWSHVHHDRYDLSKLGQWQRALSYADALGLNIHFKLQEVENNFLMDGGKLGRERRIFLREMLARFNHFLSVTWNVGEENTQEPPDLKAMTNYLASIDPYGHPIVMHTYPLQKERYRPLLGNGSALNGLSLQGSDKGFADMRPDILKWTLASRLSGRRWVIAYDEQGAWDGGAPVDADFPVARLPAKKVAVYNDRASFRRKATWNALTAGAEGINLYYGYLSGCGDLECRDHRTRARLYEDGSRAVRFFEEHVGTRALTMQADDTLTADPADYVFAEPGQTYVIYTTMAAKPVLSLFGQTGRYSVRWYDPVGGGGLRTGSVAEISGGAPDLDPKDLMAVAIASGTDLGAPPAKGSGEWVILVRRLDDNGKKL